MKVKEWNFRALPVSILGGVAMIAATFQAVVAAYSTAPITLLWWLAGLGVGWWLVFEAWRHREVVFEYDQAGMRLHSQVGWDVPWSAVRKMRVANRLGDTFLVVEAEPGLKPSPPRGWFGTIFGVPLGARIAPSVSQIPKRPKHGPQVAGPRAVSTSWYLPKAGMAIAMGILMVLGVLGVLFGDTEAFKVFSFIGAVVAVVVGAAYVRPTRRILIADQGGIRALGAKPWSVPWNEVRAVREIAGALVVAPRDSQAALEIEVDDSHRADDEDGELVVRESPRQLRQRLVGDEQLYAARLPEADREQIQQVIDHFHGEANPKQSYQQPT